MTIGSNLRQHIRIEDGSPKVFTLADVKTQVDQLEEYVAEMILLEGELEAVSTYGMSYEETTELPYRFRL